MAERTEHGWERHGWEDRPTSEALRDRENPREVYQDIETGNMVYVGRNGRTHIFTPNGKHHTSFRTDRPERRRNVRRGRWIRIFRMD